MYRPNRIGPHKIGNLNKALLVRTDANFDTLDNVWTTYSCFSLNTVSGTDFTSEHVVFSDLGLSLADNQQVGIGVQINEVDEETTRFMYSVSGSILMRTAVDLGIEMVIGRLAAAPSGTLPVIVANPIVVPIDYNMHDDVIQCSVNQTIVSTELDGGTPPSTFFDVAAFWRIVNNDATLGLCRGLHCNISFHKYTEDLVTLDPNR